MVVRKQKDGGCFVRKTDIQISFFFNVITKQLRMKMRMK